MTFLEQLLSQHKQNDFSAPKQDEVITFIEDLLSLLFPSRTGVYYKENELVREKKVLEQRLYKLILITEKKSDNRAVLNDNFWQKLTFAYNQLLADAAFFIESDPAANSIEEIFIAYPGFYAIAIHRISYILYSEGILLLSRIFSEYAHSKTGIDIHPGAKIGSPFFIDHGTGVVIGETSEIGNQVKIYQGVTLGALSVAKDMASKKRHPSIEDRVVLYAGSTILGGNTIIGHDTIIGGNVFLTQSVNPHSLVYHKSEIKVRNHPDFVEPLDFVI